MTNLDEGKTVQLTRHSRAANVSADSFDLNNNTVDIVWTTGADVYRSNDSIGTYIERLATNPENVRLDRMNAGAPFLDTHDDSGLAAIIGSVVPGSARMYGGQGLAKVQLSRSARAADTVTDIKDGVIRNVSVSYALHSIEQQEDDDGNIVANVVDWEPLEISAVPIPADPGCHIITAARSASGVELNSCKIFILKREAELADSTKDDACEDKREDDTDAEENKRAKRDDASDKKDEKDDVEARDGDGDDDEKDDKKDDKEERSYRSAELTAMIKKAAAEAVTADRKRMNEITKIGKRFGFQDAAIEACAGETSVAAFKDIVLDGVAARMNKDQIVSTSIAEPSLTTKEKDLTFARKFYGKDK